MKDMRLSRLRNHKSILLASIIMILLLVAIIPSMIKINLAEIPPATWTYFLVDPENNTATDGNTFGVDINVTNAPAGTHSWEFKLGWDNTVVNLTWGEVPTAGDFFAANATALIYTPIATANVTGSITVGQSLDGANVTSGSGTLCSLNFTVGAADSCELNLYDCLLDFVGGAVLPYPNRDGFFRETGETVIDVAVTNVVPDVTEVNIGGNVDIDVTVRNEGTGTPTFDVKVYADIAVYSATDPDVVEIGDEILIGTASFVSLADVDTDTVTWTATAGAAGETYYISANATLLTDDDLHDNVFIDGTVHVKQAHDLKVTDINILTTEVIKGQTASINVTVLNQGQNAENFNLIVYADLDTGTVGNEIEIENRTGLSLSAYPDERTEAFTWVTTGVAGGVYTISAYAQMTSTDDEPGDNWLTEGTVDVMVYDMRIVMFEVMNYECRYETRLVFRYQLKNEGTEAWAGQLVIYANMTQAYFTSPTGQLPLQPSINYSVPIGTIEPGETLTTVGVWDTEGTAYAAQLIPGKYDMSAYIVPVAGETDTGDNSYDYFQTVFIISIFDVNKDVFVNIGDLSALKKTYSGVSGYPVIPP